MDGKNKYHPILSKKGPWKNNDNSIWLGSTVALHRNLEKFKFPSKLSTEGRKQVCALVTKDLLSNTFLANPFVLLAEEMSTNDKEFLVEHFLSRHSFTQAHLGEAFVLDETGEFLASVNLADHLCLQWLDCREELEASWDRLVKIEMQLSKNVGFAFSSKFGFLTADPMICGTALSVQVLLHLPALSYSNRFDEIVKKYQDEGIERTGLQGNPHEMVGDIVSFHNQYTLGVTEENILSSLRTLTTRLLVEEKSARTHMKQENPYDMKDKVSRAYAILLHSFQIEAIEAFNAISLLKLGLDLGWLTNTTHAKLNELLFNCRRAHLLCECGEKLAHDEIPHKRAEFIHKALQGVSLHI